MNTELNKNIQKPKYQELKAELDKKSLQQIVSNIFWIVNI